MKLDAHPFIDAIACIVGGSVTVVVAVVQTVNPDIAAVLGAVLASVIAVIDARKKDKSTGHTVSVLIASGFLGGMLPGALLPLKWPDIVLPWQAWSSIGFFTGLLGWAIVLGIFRLQGRVTGAVAAQGDKLGLPPEKEEN